MAGSSVDIEILDGGLGLAAPDSDGILAFIATAETGVDNEVAVFTAGDQAETKYGEGHLTDAIRRAFAKGASIVRGIKADGDVAGSIGAVVPDGGNTGNGTLATTGSPLNDYEFVVEIIEEGDNGTATFKFSLDGGDTFSEEITVPAGAPGLFVVPNTGVTLQFTDGASPSWGAGDLITFIATGATASASSLGDAIDALKNSGVLFEGIYVAQETDSATAAAMDIKAEELLAAKDYIYILVEGIKPTAGQTADQYKASIDTEYSGYVSTSKRVGIILARAEFTNPGNNRVQEDNAGAFIAGRIASIPVNRQAGRVIDGALLTGDLKPSDINQGHINDLDDAGFTTLRTYPKRAGLYVTHGLLMAGPTSDYKFLANRRVMDKACRDVFQAALDQLQTDIPANELAIQALVPVLEVPLKRMASAARGEITSGSVVIPPGQDVLGTQELAVKIRIVSRAFIDTFKIEIGFSNPALAA